MTRNPLQMVRAPFPTHPSLSVLYAALPRPTLLWERPFSPPAPGITSPLLGFPEAAFQLSMSSDHWLLHITRNRQVWKAWLEAWPRVWGIREGWGSCWAAGVQEDREGVQAEEWGHLRGGHRRRLDQPCCQPPREAGGRPET